MNWQHRVFFNANKIIEGIISQILQHRYKNGTLHCVLILFWTSLVEKTELVVCC